MWAVRLYKTRNNSKTAIVGGHIRVNGRVQKPSYRVSSGDRVEARQVHRVWVVEVLEPIQRRVGVVEARACYIDHSPPLTEKESFSPVGKREPGSGRPTKKDRRQLNRFRMR